MSKGNTNLCRFTFYPGLFIAIIIIANDADLLFNHSSDEVISLPTMLLILNDMWEMNLFLQDLIGIRLLISNSMFFPFLFFFLITAKRKA